MLIDTTHRDIIHEIAYNFDGNQFATASSDQIMGVYNKVNGWADSKFGQLIATCSQDKGVCVWEEKKSYKENSTRQKQIQVQWKQRILILESKEAVDNIQFGSKSNRLLLAIACIDEKLQIHRVYEQNQFIKKGEDIQIIVYGLKAISWNHAFLEREMLVAAGNAEQQNIQVKQKQIIFME
ncbi:unnamed protein product [Paramecium primaurelia]|uniref:Uncharacterized protein n=1 Tax=Paramecium primaurelia TaxID=5886 RepID=A0A8S1M443_PARPR|nr:unnamed protein product [Paramecium primaurelia]